MLCAFAVSGIVRGHLRTHDYVVRTSGRSVDIFPSAVSKVKACEDFKSHVIGCQQGASVLIIGDRGDKEGNDFELLQEPYSISVDKIHWKPSTCFPVFNRDGARLWGPNATASKYSDRNRLNYAPTWAKSKLSS
jgi:hypothetical protein